MTGVCHLAWLPLAAVGGAPHYPVVLIADCITAVPKFRCDAGIGWITQHAPQLAMFDLIADLGPELEIIAFVVNRPGAICLHVNTVFGIGDQVIQLSLTRLQADIDHSDQRDAIPS